MVGGRTCRTPRLVWGWTRAATGYVRRLRPGAGRLCSSGVAGARARVLHHRLIEFIQRNRPTTLGAGSSRTTRWCSSSWRPRLGVARGADAPCRRTMPVRPGAGRVRGRTYQMFRRTDLGVHTLDMEPVVDAVEAGDGRREPGLWSADLPRREGYPLSPCSGAPGHGLNPTSSIESILLAHDRRAGQLNCRFWLNEQKSR